MQDKTMIFIIGVHKAATTSIYEYLIYHDDICPGKKKEIHYYTPLRYGKKLEDFNKYIEQFSECRDKKFLLDASPSYLYGKEKIINEIKKNHKDSKIILILRNPVDRFISFYKFLKTEYRLDENVSFKEFMEKSYALRNEPDIDDVFYRAFREGEYSKFLEPWLDTFGDSMKIVFFEDIKRDPKQVMLDLADFLGINQDVFYEIDYFVRNKTQKSKFKSIYQIARYINLKFEYFFRKHPEVKLFLKNVYFKINGDKLNEEIPEELINELKKLYSDSNKELKKILLKHNYQLPEWLIKDDNVT